MTRCGATFADLQSDSFEVLHPSELRIKLK